MPAGAAAQDTPPPPGQSRGSPCLPPRRAGRGPPTHASLPGVGSVWDPGAWDAGSLPCSWQRVTRSGEGAWGPSWTLRVTRRGWVLPPTNGKKWPRRRKRLATCPPPPAPGATRRVIEAPAPGAARQHARPAWELRGHRIETASSTVTLGCGRRRWGREQQCGSGSPRPGLEAGTLGPARAPLHFGGHRPPQHCAPPATPHPALSEPLAL